MDYKGVTKFTVEDLASSKFIPLYFLENLKHIKDYQPNLLRHHRESTKMINHRPFSIQIHGLLCNT